MAAKVPYPDDRLASGTSSVTSTGQSLVKVRQFHDEAFLYVEQGLSCDEQGFKEQAVTLYSKGIHCIDMAFGALPSDWESGRGGENSVERCKVTDLLCKMERTRSQVQSRVEKLISTDAGAARALHDPPPSYEQATTPTESDFDMLLDASLAQDSSSGSSSPEASATELFRIQEGVQIFYITREGYVSAPSYPSGLTIYRLHQSLLGLGALDGVAADGAESSDTFIKVSDWTYPLIPGRSPVLHASWGAYVFPDVTATGNGNAVGVIIPDTVSPTERAKFEQIMNTHTVMRDQSADGMSSGSQPQLGEEEGTSITSERTSDKISRGLETAAEWITWGVMKGASKTGDLLKKGSTHLQETLTPEGQPAKVNPQVQKGVYYTRQATEGMCKVSGFIIKKLGQGTMALARQAAPHLRKQGEKVLPESFVRKDDEGFSRLDDVCNVASSGLRGWATVYVGLEQAAKVLAETIASETVQVVEHKYGKEAGAVTGDAMYSGANVALTAYNTANMGATAIAKRAAKDAGKAVVVDQADSAKKMARTTTAATTSGDTTSQAPSLTDSKTHTNGNSTTHATNSVTRSNTRTTGSKHGNSTSNGNSNNHTNSMTNGSATSSSNSASTVNSNTVPSKPTQAKKSSSK